MKLGLGIQGTQIKPKVVTIHITKLNWIEKKLTLNIIQVKDTILTYMKIS